MEERGTGKEVEYLLFIERLLAGSSVKQFSRSVFIIRNRVNRVKRHFYLKKKLERKEELRVSFNENESKASILRQIFILE